VTEPTPSDAERLASATAKSINAYYAAEIAFADEPNGKNLQTYLVAMDRFVTLRDHLRQAYLAADAMLAMEGMEAAEGSEEAA
jgi:hypothetical protein